MYFSLFMLIIISVCCGVYKYEKSNSLELEKFPKALVFNAKPIHPDCVLSTQFGDSSRLIPKLVYSEIEESNEENFVTITNQIIDYSKIDKNIVRYVKDYQYDEHDNASTYHAEITYQAWKVTDDISLVLVNHYDTSGTGRFTDLGFVRREGDYLINSEEIASGDRAHGLVCVDFFYDGIVQFRTAATLITILKSVCPEEMCLPDTYVDSPFDYAGELIWQHHIQDGKTTKSKLIGIAFSEGSD